MACPLPRHRGALPIPYIAVCAGAIKSLALAGAEEEQVEEFTSAINNLTVLLIVIGGSIFTLCLAAGAILFMTAAGDPHKQQLAKGALMGAVIGVVVLAMSPIAPRVLSRFVIEPSGGQALDRVGQSGRDDTLRSALITQRGVGTAARANSMISQIQSQRRNECSAEVWAPIVTVGADANACVGGGEDKSLAGTLVPKSLYNSGAVTSEDGLTRDAEGNIMVEWETASRPTDTALCWMYIANADIWVSHTANAQ